MRNPPQPSPSVGAWSTSWNGCSSVLCQRSSEPGLNYVGIWLLWFFAVEGRLEWEEARIISHLNGAEGELTKGVSKELAWKEVWGERGRMEVGGLKTHTVTLTRWSATEGAHMGRDLTWEQQSLWWLFMAINTVQNMLKGFILC